MIFLDVLVSINFGALWSHFGPNLVLFWSQFDSLQIYFGPTLSLFGPILGNIWPLFTQLCPFGSIPILPRLSFLLSFLFPNFPLV